ncbi:hypothetical protein IV454_20920 [Massilia antarctica]|uniref:Uncharacterized protein n=1 Tax=Massilia antarctica TaxID=2765360 RepID=A0AA48WB48_9BURK|nr:hypothetical protein [Massilia antarctica]QPI48010.1 hypothetical protein IV454_20920 [Massilia antarctica]
MQTTPPSAQHPYSYAAITAHCADQIAQLMADARRQSGAEARYRYERAYGVYIGWRALVGGHADHALFARDDKRLEALLAATTHSRP